MSGSSTGWIWRKASDGKWRPLTSHYFWDNNYGAGIVCRDMGFATGTRTKTRNHHNREDFDSETGYRRCAASSHKILDCRKYGGPNNNDKSAQAHVRCTGQWKPTPIGKTGSEFRISGATSGWVHRKGKDGQWRPLTSHYFWDNNYGATIVCENLGFAKGTRGK
jgi:REP element-mobilizing transposase RayT